MDEIIDQIIALTGNEHRYQYFNLIVMMFLWINCNFIFCILPFIEREPKVNYIDLKGIFHENETLTSDICIDLHGNNFTVVKSYDFSWINEFHIECKSTEISNIGAFAFIGNSLGGFIFSFVNKFLSHKKIIIVSSFIFCISIFLCTLVKSFDYFYFLLICEIFIGLSGNFLSYSSLIIAQEIVSNKKRFLFSNLIRVGYSICGIIFSLIFLLLKDWRKVFYILVGTSCLALIIIWIFIYDSPKEYIKNNEFERGKEILEGIAKFNGKLESFRESVKQDFFKIILRDLKKLSGIEEREKSSKTGDKKVINQIYKENERNPRPFKKENSDNKYNENRRNKKQIKSKNSESQSKYFCLFY